MCTLPLPSSHFVSKNILEIIGTNRDMFSLELGKKKAGIVWDIHLIPTTWKALAQSFQTVRGSFLHILRATYIFSANITLTLYCL